MGLMLEAALKYKNVCGFSVIPVRPMDKKPDLVKWDDFKTRKAEDDEIRQWWDQWPDANVGIVTGAISGISVIDIDTPEAEEALCKVISKDIKTPMAMTPRGGMHVYFKYDPRVPSVSSKVIKNVDTKSDGGMVVAAPSIRAEGKYFWIDKPTITPYANFPEEYLALLTKAAPMASDFQTELVGMFDHGKRDDSLFHVANKLFQSRTPESEVRQILTQLALSWGENDPKWINAKVDSAMKRSAQRERDIINEVKQWCAVQDGPFRLEGCFNELSLQTKEQKAECRKVIIDLSKQGILERDKGIGIYRLLRKDIEFIAIPDEELQPLDISLPLGISSWAQIRQRNVVIVTGTSNSGKTAMGLNIAMRNMDKFKIRYQSSEMTGDELYVKLKHMPRTLQEFREKVEWINRASDWWDIVIPDALNIIDFMEIYENFYEVGAWIKKVHDRLTTGIAIIVLQKKDANTDTGRGGAITKEKARLYISMDYGCLTIVKAKHWADHQDPNGKKIDFTLDKGVNFKNSGTWR